ncbi:hypothetical protein [Paenibacillus sp. FSL W8-0194]|uniref:hypothetical protein n=1 Tax=Paenibacillus sp. FSL W8-0194 TaxID=2921711 RepID=UPI0030D6DC7A
MNSLLPPSSARSILLVKFDAVLGKLIKQYTKKGVHYEPAPLDEETISKLREYERQISREAGYPVVLIAYADQDQPASQ